MVLKVSIVHTIKKIGVAGDLLFSYRYPILVLGKHSFHYYFSHMYLYVRNFDLRQLQYLTGSHINETCSLLLIWRPYFYSRNKRVCFQMPLLFHRDYGRGFNLEKHAALWKCEEVPEIVTGSQIFRCIKLINQVAIVFIG